MLRILIAVDGSEAAVRATHSVIESVAWYKQAPQIDVVAVHMPVPRLPNMGLVISHDMLDNYYREECEAMLARSKSALADAGVSYTAHWHVGAVADTIVEKAQDLESNLIYMGTRGMTGISSLILGSTALKVLHLTHIPVVLIH